MNNQLLISRFLLLIVILLLPACSPPSGQANGTAIADSEPPAAETTESSASKDVPISRLTQGGSVRNWAIIGAFPQENIQDSEPNAPSRTGYHHDFLGGEADFRLRSVDTLELPGGATAGVQRIQARKDGRVQLNPLFEKNDMAVAYAYCLVESDRDQEVILGFGSDDSAKVWLNGELVYEIWVPRRGTREDEEMVRIQLREGLNPLLVKVEEQTHGWNFHLNLYTDKTLADQKEKRDRKRYGSFAVGPVEERQHIFPPGKFPEISWRYPGMVEKYFGRMPYSVRWFDGDLLEVKSPSKPGRYLMYFEAKHPSGVPIRRAMTFYCRPAGWRHWIDEKSARYSWTPGKEAPFDAATFKEHPEAISFWLSRHHLQGLGRNLESGFTLAYLAELSPQADADALHPSAPIVAHNDSQLRLKLKVLGMEDKVQPLALPVEVPTAKPTLRVGTLAEAGFRPGLQEAVRKIAQEWATDNDGANGPFTLLVARDGVIVFHESFEAPGHNAVNLETKHPVASITKAVSGLLVAQFLEQGHLQLDDPVGKYLPDFPLEGSKMLTLRQCFDHTSGLTGHWGYSQGGPTNPYLDNLIVHELLRELTPGQKFLYNGNGLNLGGRVMEVIGGKAIQRLFQENLFAPLGVEGASILALGSSGRFSAHDIASFGQLLSNKGTYGNKRFFSEEVYEQLLPRPLSDKYPDIADDREYGVGLSWMNSKKAADSPAEKSLPYPNEKWLGHGSATASVLQVGMESGIVIAAGRQKRGENASQYVNRIVRAVREHTLAR